MLVLGAVLSLFVGLLLGLLGGGGAILTLPMLVYVLHVDSKDAIASSLVVVGTTSFVGMLSHARAGAVQWRVGTLFGLAAMAGAFGGGRLAAVIPGHVLLVAFGVIMVTTSTLMMRGRKDTPETSGSINTPVVMLLGALVGLISGLVGAGGGFLIVPALSIFGGLPMRQAIGTSLFVIAMQSGAGFLGHMGHAHLNATLLVAITSSAILGSLAGTALSKHVPAPILRRGFAWFVVCMGMFMFFKQLSLPIAAAASALTLVAVTVVIKRQRVVHAN
jgi:uncharacterized protein